MKELNRNKKLNRKPVVTINGAAARTQGKEYAVKEQYYAMYPNPPRLRKSN